MVKTKRKDFIGAVTIMHCKNSSWIMGLRIYGEERTQISPSSHATIGPLPRIQDRQGLYWYLYWYNNTIQYNTKINQIIVSFTDHYNAISVERLPWKIKIGKGSWYFNNPFLCKLEVSSATKTFLVLLKTQKKQVHSQWTPGI